MQGRHWATVLGHLTCAPGTFGEAGVLREMGAVGIRPPIPSPLPPKPECGFAARCPGRPGRCAAHVKYTRVQTGEVCARVGLEPHAWAPAVPAGSPKPGTPVGTQGSTSAQNPGEDASKSACVCGVCVCVCVCARPRAVTPSEVGKGYYLWGGCAPSSPIGA